MPGGISCPGCSQKVAKSAKALRCSCCREWYHATCSELEEADYHFMSKRTKFGFRWFCPDCVVDADENVGRGAYSRELEKKFQSMEVSLLESMEKLGERLDLLEQKPGPDNLPSQVAEAQQQSFVDIVKKALEEKKEPCVVVKDHGQSRTVEDQNVLIVKPKVTNSEAGSTNIADSVPKIEEALGEIQVSSCRKTKLGNLVVKFPTEEAKHEATRAINDCLGPDHTIHVTEPRKMLPKMTVPDIDLSMDDAEIVPSITRKNLNIQKLVDEGYTFTLIFAKTRDMGKTAVLKMAPEIRSEIVKNGNSIFVGMKRCKAYDRFWVNQCYHCQAFGHISSSCPEKNSHPVCAFCSGAHRSNSCTEKNSPQCANCLKLESGSAPTNHFASSSSCPVMMSQRRIVIENTNFTSSKNPLDQVVL